MEGEPNEQDPFNLDEWEESKHPRKENGQFGKGSGNGENQNNIEKSSRSDKIKKELVKKFSFLKKNINTNLTKQQKQKKQIIRAIGSNVYIVENNGFNEYRIIKKYELDWWVQT